MIPFSSQHSQMAAHQAAQQAAQAAQAAHVAQQATMRAQMNVALIVSIFDSRDMERLMMDEAEEQVAKAIALQSSNNEPLQARALAIAVMAAKSALEAWANRILVTLDAKKWSKTQLEGRSFCFKWQQIFAHLGWTWDETQNPALALVRLNKTRQLFEHYKPKRGVTTSDPFKTVGEVQPWITEARQLMTNTEHLT